MYGERLFFSSLILFALIALLYAYVTVFKPCQFTPADESIRNR